MSQPTNPPRYVDPGAAIMKAIRDQGPQRPEPVYVPSSPLEGAIADHYAQKAAEHEPR